ncbi:MAG: hypothetical protein KVP17_001008 [Porospora cf. gigantea B]|uniref:uncharacterized protein n=1 Tax=Porospora cf. gigantea B TaxID=2853592 RepID=UPI003571F13C|nr:MAG: hypothetical protein KVP17_001008 [Porospora cf. gigantea B]
MCKKGVTKLAAKAAKLVIRAVVKRQAKKALKGQVVGIVRRVSPLLSSTASILKGPTLKAFLAGPLIKPISALGNILRTVPLHKVLPKLLKLTPKLLGPAVSALRVGPARGPVLALCRALKLKVFMAVPILTGVAFAVLLVGPPVTAFLESLTTGFIQTMMDLVEPLLDLLLISPLVKRLLNLVRPIVRSILSLIQVLMFGDTLLPLLSSAMALPKMLAGGLAETGGVSSFLPTAYDLLNSQ